MMSDVSSTGCDIRLGVPADQIDRALALYYEAFGAKLQPMFGDRARALRFLARYFQPDRAFVALNGTGQVIGIAGFKQDGRGLLNPPLGSFFREYGISALFRLVVAIITDRKEEEGTLLMDGIAVAAEARGGGIGTSLLQAIADHAKALGRRQVRLDVIDTNPGARRLYERFGFAAKETIGIGPLQLLFDFKSTTKMLLTV